MCPISEESETILLSVTKSLTESLCILSTPLVRAKTFNSLFHEDVRFVLQFQLGKFLYDKL
jgi:hypothetical protein